MQKTLASVKLENIHNPSNFHNWHTWELLGTCSAENDARATLL
jgi:hypothetical protein